MKSKTTIILLVLAVLLGVYIFIIEQKLPTTDELEESAKKVFAVKSQDINRIEIGAPNASHLPDLAGQAGMTVGTITPTVPTRITVACVRANNQWEMVQPVKTRADQSVLEGIVNQLSDLQKKETLKEVPDLTPYGLHQPPITMTFQAKDKTYSLKLGNKAPLNIGTYLAVEGRKEVYVVAEHFVNSINKSISDFRHKKIFDTNTYDISMLKLVRPQQTIELQKIDDEWRITGPVSEKAEQTKIRDILSQMSTLSVSTFVADMGSNNIIPSPSRLSGNETDLIRYGLDRPELKVIVPDPLVVSEANLKDSTKSETLWLGRESETYKDQFIGWKEGSQTIFTIDKNSYEILTTPLNNIRSKKFFELTPAQVNKIEIKYKQKVVVTLNKDADNKWQFVYPSMTVTGSAPYDVDSFIEKLNTYNIEQFVADTTTDLARYGLGGGGRTFRWRGDYLRTDQYYPGIKNIDWYYYRDQLCIS
ncbi:MAG: DUF4340 domain-containing protein [Planctomycetota bacterium]|nr:DUF4340 domain-containing protein [Planctomycetota bacterium]MDI6786915.1 DUF4340 domain-containing protein [Planctomycetota bacterium]